VTRKPNKHLLVVFHSQSGNTGRLIEAASRGAHNGDIDGVDVRTLTAVNAHSDDLLWADGLILGTAENFGYMSGAIKDFLDRTYYEVEGKIQSLPYALIVSANNDGTGAVRSIERIVGGYPFKSVQEPLIVVGDVSDKSLGEAEELGLLLAAGLESGIF